MDRWLLDHTLQRRDELLADALRERLVRQARGRPATIRGRIATGALAMSTLLANFAYAMRETN